MKKLSGISFLLAVLFCAAFLAGCSGYSSYYNLDAVKRISLFQRYPLPDALSEELKTYVSTRSGEALRVSEAELDAYADETYQYLVDKTRAYYLDLFRTPDSLSEDERSLFQQIRQSFESSMKETDDLFFLNAAAELFFSIQDQTEGVLLSEKLSALSEILPQADALDYNSENKKRLFSLLKETADRVFAAASAVQIDVLSAFFTAELEKILTLKEAPSEGIRYDFLRVEKYRYSTQEEIYERLKRLKTCEINGVVLDRMLENDRTAYYDTDRNVASKHTKVLEYFLTAAKELNMTVFIGLSDHDLFGYAQLPTDEWLAEQITRNETTAKEIYEKYYPAYADTIAGWYFPYEIPSLHPTQGHADSAEVKTLSGGIDALKNYLTLLDPDLPLLITPVYSDDNKSTEYSIESQWGAIAEQTHLNESDLIAPHDDLTDSSPVYNTHALERANRYFGGYLRGLTDKKPRLGVTLDLLETEHKPTAERIASQITLAKKFGDEIFSQYFSETLDGTLQVQEYLAFLRISDLYAFDFSFSENL